jgi:hypothetical protein
MEQVPVILLSSSSSESESGNMNMNRKRKYEDEYRLISDLTGFDNLRAMIEAEKSRKKRKNKNKNKNTSSQPNDAMSDMQQSGRVQAVQTTGALDAKAVEVNKILAPHKIQFNGNIDLEQHQ